MKYIHTQIKHDYKQLHNYLDRQVDIRLGKRLKNT